MKPAQSWKWRKKALFLTLSSAATRLTFEHILSIKSNSYLVEEKEILFMLLFQFHNSNCHIESNIVVILEKSTHIYMESERRQSIFVWIFVFISFMHNSVFVPLIFHLRTLHTGWGWRRGVHERVEMLVCDWITPIEKCVDVRWLLVDSFLPYQPKL